MLTDRQPASVIARGTAPCLIHLFRQFPLVTVTGPRQSGETTVCRETFPDLAYVNLEAPDPRGFLARLGEGAIQDGLRLVPEPLSYVQVLANEKGRGGPFILTGSEYFKRSEGSGHAFSRSSASSNGGSSRKSTMIPKTTIIDTIKPRIQMPS